MKLHIVLLFSVISLFSVKSVLSQQLVSVHATQLEPRKEAGYKFVIETADPVTKNASFDIVFPGEFLLNNLIMGSSTTMNGGLIVTVNNDTVRVSRSGLGAELPSGQIDISVWQRPPHLLVEIEMGQGAVHIVKRRQPGDQHAIGRILKGWIAIGGIVQGKVNLGTPETVEVVTHKSCVIGHRGFTLFALRLYANFTDGSSITCYTWAVS